MSERQKKVCIVVLGDVGRSPRMNYHALSFADEGYKVELLGYSESQVFEKLRNHPNVKVKYLSSCPDFKQHLPMVLAYFLKVVWQIITLLMALLLTNFPDYILVQNPPAVPTLALSLSPDHSLVRISERFEFYCGKRASANICVTKAMKENLETSHGIIATTFYDRPPDIFKTVSTEEKHKLFLSLGIEYSLFLEGCNFNETIFTNVVDSKVVLKEHRPALIVSSTSWTEDEDFSILLDALEEYENARNNSTGLPKVICVITGKGPLKEFYTAIIKKKEWKHVQIITPWLKAEDYPTFLACCDLGVCLHTSSSGLDLPMKVVDMFGCSLPVCAINFKCISELVKHEENGFIFNNSNELSNQLRTWFMGFPTSSSTFHNRFIENLKQFNALRWHDNWKFNVQPLLQDQ